MKDNWPLKTKIILFVAFIVYEKVKYLIALKNKKEDKHTVWDSYTISWSGIILKHDKSKKYVKNSGETT